LDDGRTDLVAEGLDMSVRIATSLKDTSQVAQRLAVVPQLLVASPEYLKRRGMPQSIADLAAHDCMVHALKSPTNIWTFLGDAQAEGAAASSKTSVRVHGTIRANYGEPLRHAALLGHGISMHPTYMVMQDIQEGRLVSVLPQFRPVGVDIYAVFPSRKNVPIRVRTFLDFLRQWFAAADWHAYQNVP
jgi:DNA-binding transcriptional LysR family regulator